MLTLLSECHFWTFREEVRIKSTDLGAFRYLRQREVQQTELGAAAKRDYLDKRNSFPVLKNGRKGAQRRLKDNLKKLEELLKTHKVVHTQWRDATQLLLLFSNGIILYICIDIFTGDILRIVFEKYFVGKLAAETITDAFLTRSHIVLAYNTNQLTVVHMQKPCQRFQRPEKISNMDPRIFHVIIPGPSDRKVPRHLTVNSSFDLFVIWTKSSQNEVYPWRPTTREADRANIHIFKLKESQLESISYCWSEHDPLCVDFLRSSESQILIVEEKVSRKGEISGEICSYEITSGRMQRSTLSSIPIGTHICCVAFSPDQEKLFLGAIDKKICLHDLVQQTTKFVTEVDVIPTHCSWHSDSSTIMIANDRSQFQCFDLALTPIGNQLQSEDVTPSNILDLSHYFTQQPTLLNIVFSCKPDLGSFTQAYAQTDCFLFFLYENGPIGILRFFAGAGMRGDIHISGLTADVIIDKYLSLNQLEKAVNLLHALNWETYGAMCLISLHKIAHYVFYRSETRPSRNELLGRALKTFTDSLSEETKDEFSDQVFDLKRRFFFFLLRKNLFAEAFEVALDTDDYDLFMDLYNVTKSNIDLIEFSAAAFSQAVALLHEEERANGTQVSLMGDYRSESVCSQLTTSTDTAVTTLQKSKKQFNKNALKNYVPPLPSLKSKVFNAEMIKIPKPELTAKKNDVVDSAAVWQAIDSEITALNRGIGVSSSITVNSTPTEISSKNDYINNNQNQLNKSADVNGPSTNFLNVPEQTIGVPITSFAPITHASTNNSSSLPTYSRPLPMKPVQKLDFVPIHQHAAPITIVEQLAVAQRDYHQPPPPRMPYMYQPKFYQHPLVSGTIPPTTSAFLKIVQDEQQKRLLAPVTKKPAASILSNTTSSTMTGTTASSSILTNNMSSTTIGTSNGFRDANVNGLKPASGGEKNKVKFSDTVQVAVVPDIQRKDKPMPPKRNGYSRPMQRNPFTNPKKELADSLPLCHPNDDYLKDFNPLPADTSLRPVQAKSLTSRDERKTSKTVAAPPSIKVVHFGVV